MSDILSFTLKNGSPDFLSDNLYKVVADILSATTLLPVLYDAAKWC